MIKSLLIVCNWVNDVNNNLLSSDFVGSSFDFIFNVFNTYSNFISFNS